MSPKQKLRLLCLENRLAPATLIWDGGGTDNHWKTDANWVGDVAPMPGDDLEFPTGAARLQTFNDYAPGTNFRSILVSGLNYSYSGGAISIASDFTADLPNSTGDLPTVLVILPIILTGSPLTINAVNANTQSIHFTEPITGDGGIVKLGGGPVIFSGANSYTALTDVRSGVLQITSNTALGAAGIGNETMIAIGATLELSGITTSTAESISFIGRGVNRTVNGQVVSAGAISQFSGNNSLTGPLTLIGDALISGQIALNSSLTIANSIVELGGSFKLEIGQVGSGLIFASSSMNTYSGGTIATFNTQFDGQGVGPVIVTGGFFRGNGSVGPLTSTPSMGTGFDAEVVPSVGGMNTSDLNLAGRTRFDIELQDLGRFFTKGTVTLSGPLTVSLGTYGPDFEVQPGAIYRIIDNDGADAVVGTFLGLSEGAIVPGASAPVPLKISYHGGDGNDVVLIGASQTALATGAGPGGEPRVNVFDANGHWIRTFLAYPAGFRGGVHVATADLNNDSVPDIITGAGAGGGPLVRIWDGASFAMIREFYAYDPNFAGGVFVAAADIFPDGQPDIVTGAGPGGGPHVKIYDGASGSERSSFFAYDASFRGGVSVAGRPGLAGGKSSFDGSVITGAGPGGGPHVRAFDVDGVVQSEFFAFDPSFRGGVSVAYNPDPLQDLALASIVTAPMSNGVPVVQLFTFSGQLRANFFAYDPSFQGGVNLAVLPLGDIGRNVLFTGAGSGGGPHVREWTYDNGPVLLGQFMAFDPAFTGGVFVG